MSEEPDMIEPYMKQEGVNRFPTEDHRLIFDHWKVDFYVLTPFELTIAHDWITFIVRTGHHIFKWEYLRRSGGAA